MRTALNKEVPGQTLDRTLLLATWNLREFGGTKFGGRDKEALYYIAQVLSHFDLIAVQEVRDNLDELEELMGILGHWWSFLVTDETAGRAGNCERMAFVFDRRKVKFGGLAGEQEGPTSKDGNLLRISDAFARAPFMAGFQAGWFKFSLCTGHLYYGDSKPDDPERLEETRTLVSLLKKRTRNKDQWARNIIVLGDFNLFSTKDKMMKEIHKVFETPPAVEGAFSNALRTKPFDQIGVLSPEMHNRITQSRGGVFDVFEHVYRDEDEATYKPLFGDHDYRMWRTFKASDHLPLWVELEVDFADEYLQCKAKEHKQ